ncbi:MAG TPA: carboxypeptidase-like regulatory domain-containing protein [Mucilaginibacter sp.]
MIATSYSLKTGLMVLILFMCPFALININGQTKPAPKTVTKPKAPTPSTATTTTTTTTTATPSATYTVRGSMSDGKLLKFTHLAVVDVHGKVVSRWVTDSMGLFKITGLAKGKYKLVNSALGVDAPFSVPKQSENTFIVNVSACSFGSAKAQKDIKEGKPMLLLSGGIAPVSSPKEDNFERKYSIRYHDFGDAPQSIKCSEAYNNVVIAFLDKKFGKSWRRDARADVIGLKR